MKLFLILIFLVNSVFAFSQKGRFYFSDSLCAYEGFFREKKITGDQLYNTFFNLLTFPDFEYTVVPGTFDELLFLSEETLNDDVDFKLLALNQILIPNNTYWEKIREKRIYYQLERAKLRKAVLRAYQSPETLLTISVPVGSAAYSYRELLIGKDSAGIVAVLQDIKAKNEELIFCEEQDLRHLKFDLIRYGWWPEAQKYLPGLPSYEELFDAFLKLFKKVKKSC